MSEAEAFPIVPRPFTFQDVEGALIDGEWHVRDVALAERLGLERVRKVREVIERNKEELESFGPLPFVRAMVAIGSGARREVKEYYLNQSQVLLIAMLGRTEASRRLRADMIRVYNEWHASGMPAKVREANFWRRERWRLAERRLALVSEMARARAALAAAEDRVAEAAGAVARLETEGARVGREYEVAALVEADEAGGDGAALFARRLASLSVAACVYLLVVEEPAELARDGSLYVSEPLRTELARRFDIRLSVRDLTTTIDRLKSCGALVRADPIRSDRFPSFLVTKVEADATAAEVDAVAKAVSGATIDPALLAAAIAGLGLPNAVVVGRASTRLAVAVVAALVQAGVEGRIDAGAIIAAGLSEAVAGRRTTLEMRKCGTFPEHEEWVRTFCDNEMEGRRIERKISVAGQADAVKGFYEDADLSVDCDAPRWVEEDKVEADMAKGCSSAASVATGSPSVTIAEAVVATLRAHPAGLTRAEIPDAASLAAGTALKPISVTGQLPRMQAKGLIACDDGRWRAIEQLPSESAR